MTDQELNGHFEGITRQFEAMNRRFDAVDQRLDDTNARLERVEETARRVDVGVHRNGILLEGYRGELRLATESFQTLERVNSAKIDGLRESIDHCLVPLDRTVRSHSDDLARHERLLGRREER